jgi:stage II sporulation protein M
MNVITLWRGHRKKRFSAAGGFIEDAAAALRSNKCAALLAVLLLSGMTFGSFRARGAGYDSLIRLDFLFASNFRARAELPYYSVFLASFASSFLFVLACFLCGLSMWGTFLIPFLAAFRGYGLGLVAGYLYSSQGWKGALFYLSVLLPGAFLCCLAILAAGESGMRCSRFLASRAFRGNGNLFEHGYLLKFGKYLGTAFAAAGLDTLLFAALGRWFSF